MAFTITDFQKAIPSDIVKLGEQLFKKEAVKNLQNLKEQEWTAEVLDKETFNIEIMLDDERNILDHFCDCPTESEHCAHQVAALLKLRQTLPKYEQKQTKAKAKKEKEVKVKKKTDPIGTILDEVSLSELKEFVQKAAAAQKEFKNMLLVHFSDKSASNNRKYYTDVLRTGISNVKRSGPLNVKDTKRFLPVAEQLWKKAQEGIIRNNLKDASQILLAMLETFLPQSERLSDSTGAVMDLTKSTYTELQKVIQNAPFEFQKAVVSELFEVLNANMSFYYNHFRRDTFKLLGAIAQYPELHLSYAQFLDNLLKNPDIKNRGYSSFWSSISATEVPTLESEVVNLKRELFKLQKRDSEIHQLLAKYQHIEQFRREYVEYCLTQKDYAEVRAVIEKYIFVHKHESMLNGIHKYWYETLLGVYVLQKDLPAQIRLLHTRFIGSEYQNMEVLAQLKQCCTKAEWKGKFDEILKAATKSFNTMIQFNYYDRWRPKPFPVKIANLLTFDERWDELWQLLRNENKVEGYGQYGHYLAATHAHELYELYKNNARKWAEAVSNMDEYRAIAYILTTLRDLNDAGAELVQGIMTHLRIAHKRKYQYLNLLKDAGL